MTQFTDKGVYLMEETERRCRLRGINPDVDPANPHLWIEQVGPIMEEIENELRRPKPLTEGLVDKGGQNPPYEGTTRPPAPGGSRGKSE